MEYGAAAVLDFLAHAGERVDDGLVGWDLAVENTQGIGDGAALAIAAHGIDHWRQRLTQSLVESRPAVGAADGVELERPSGDAQAVEQRGEHFQQFRVSRRGLAAARGWANHFRADLIELSVSSFLRAFAAELWANVVELVEAAIPEPVFDIGADDASGVFRAQR